MNRAIFSGGMRTPFGKAGKGAYVETRPDDLLIELLAANRRRFPDIWEGMPDDLVVGCAYPEGEQGYNVARMVAIGAGLACPGVTVNRLCASSLEAIAIAASRVACGWGSKYLVGGVESMSKIPRRGANFSESEKIKSLNPLAYTPNGETAELVAKRFPAVTRRRQEDLAARSHELAEQAYTSGLYATQIHPFLIERDEFVRVPVDREKMESLKPAFRDDGIVTAATSSPLTDGATCGWVIEMDEANRLGVHFGIEILDATVSHIEPELMGLGPIPATRLILERNDLTVENIAAFEINEAFAVQVLASIDELGIPIEKTNCWGGAMAVGHPLGASGLRLMMTLHDRLREADQQNALGIATLCVGGGQGMSILVRYFRE